MPIPLIQGTTNMSIKMEDIVGGEVPLLSLDEQQILVARFYALDKKIRQVRAYPGAVERDSGHLLALCFRDAIAAVLLRPIAEIAPLVCREQSTDLDGSYPELGSSSFDKGIFHKPSLKVQHTLGRPQAEITAIKKKHTAIREVDVALLPAALERVFAEDH